MIQKILVPVDGSPCSERAIPVAAHIARRSQGRVILVYATNLGAYFGPALAPYPVISPTLIENEQENAERYLAHIVASPELAGLDVETVIRQEEAASAIISTADTYEVDLIILCSHGRTGMKRWALGSIAEKVVHRTLKPVLLLREKGPLPLGPHPDPTTPFRVMVPLDGSPLAKIALEPAARLASLLSSQSILHLVKVVSPTYPQRAVPLTEQEIASTCQHARSYLEQTIHHIREGLVALAIAHLPLTLTCSVVTAEDVAGALVDLAEKGSDAKNADGRCDLIAIATHGRGGFQRWMLGSVTERVLHATRLPLLIVHPEGAIAFPADAGSQKKQEPISIQ